MAVRAPAPIPDLGSGRPRIVRISGTILIGASGAVTSSTGELSTNPVVKTAAETGRYSVAFLRKYRNVRVTSLVLVGPADAALTATDGNDFFARNVTGSGFDIQARQTSYADANPASGNSIHWAVEAQL
jgi:hypothetical protein